MTPQILKAVMELDVRGLVPRESSAASPLDPQAQTELLDAWGEVIEEAQH